VLVGDSARDRDRARRGGQNGGGQRLAIGNAGGFNPACEDADKLSRAFRLAWLCPLSCRVTSPIW
jgi:hypothetical protein